MKYVLFLTILLFTLSAFLFYPKRTVTITLTDEGFKPERVRIRQGGAVTFKNETTSPFWPASDAHPDHTDYPEFDPKKAINPGGTWSFTVDKAGRWEYHDHLAPYYTGVIQTGSSQDSKKQAATPLPKDPCKGIREVNEFHNCWVEYYTTLARYEGVDAALTTLKKKSGKDDLMSAYCHVFADFIGVTAYELDPKGESFSIPPTTICQYGFYHGFTLEQTSHSRNFKTAYDFCSTADTVSGKPKGELLANCTIGVGNGLTYRYMGKYWKNEEEIMARSIADCETLAEPMVPWCIRGVYSGITHMYFGMHDYRLDIHADDPFWVCHSQPARYRPICYDDLVPAYYGHVGRDMKRTAEAIRDTIPDHTMATVAAWHLGDVAYVRDYVTKGSYEEAVDACRILPHTLHLACLRGLVEAMYGTGPADSAREKTEGFCNATYLSPDEAEVCHTVLTHPRRP